MMNCSQAKIGSQFRQHRLGFGASYLIVFILVFASLRGWAVLNLNVRSDLVYGISSFLVVSLAMYGFNCRSRIKNNMLMALRNILKINLILGLVYVLGTILFGGSIGIPVLYTYVVPYIIFTILRIPEEKIQLVLLVVALGISYSVIDNFRISLSGIEGLEYLIEYNLQLRPFVFEAMSRTGEFLRVGGYTGSYHDSANILGMLGSYYYVRIFTDKVWPNLIVAIIVLLAMTLTQSAANIVIAMVTCFIFTIYLAVKKQSISFYSILITGALLLLYIATTVTGVLVFFDRVGANGDWAGMSNKLSIDVFFTIYFWLGYGYTFGSEYITTEIGFLKDILERGIVGASLLYWILVYPAYIYVKFKPLSLAMLPPLAAVVFGFLSLVHYGSLFRITNITIFYTMYSLFMLQLIKDNERVASSKFTEGLILPEKRELC